MKHLIAMLFYNIVIGSKVMFNEDYENYQKEKFGDSILSKYIWAGKKYKVVGMYSTFFKSIKPFTSKKQFRSNDFFRIMIAIENTSGYVQYVGIKAVKELTI